MRPHIQAQNITKDRWLLQLEMFKGCKMMPQFSYPSLFTDG